MIFGKKEPSYVHLLNVLAQVDINSSALVELKKYESVSTEYEVMLTKCQPETAIRSVKGHSGSVKLKIHSTPKLE